MAGINPNLPRLRAAAETRVAGRRLANSVNGSIGVSFGTALVNGIDAGLSRMPQFAKALGVALRDDILRADRLAVNTALAEGAAAEVHAKYLTRSPRRVEEPYRVGGNRLSGGILGEALSNIAEMTAGTTRSRIAFLNEEYLDEQAPHWARINFGAGSKHGANPKAYAVLMVRPGGGETEVARLQFGDLHRPAMKFPHGFWTGEGNNEFYPKAAKDGVPKFTEVSARATQFLDAGLKFLAQNAGNAYVRMIQEAYQDPAKRAEIERRFGSRIRIDARAGGGVSFVGRRVST